jgi:hypothetical protein
MINPLVPWVELAQLIMILGYTITTWPQETPGSKLVCVWWASVLSVDLFIWRGNRPIGIRDLLNCFDVSIGFLLIYAKFRNILRRYYTSLVAFLVDVFTL